MAKRTRIDIIADILISIQEKGRMKPTHLMYKANMAHNQMKSYLEELIQKEFVTKTKKNNYTYLLITDKGCDFIKKLREMKGFEKVFGL